MYLCWRWALLHLSSQVGPNYFYVLKGLTALLLKMLLKVSWGPLVTLIIFVGSALLEDLHEIVFAVVEWP